MTYHSEPRTPVWLTFITAGTIAGLALINKYNSEKVIASPLSIENHVQDPRIDLVKKLYEKAAGEDGAIQGQEKVKLIRSLGLDVVVDEAEVLSIVPSDNEDKLTVYLIAGKFDRYLGNGQYGKVGEVELKTAREYLKSKK